MPITYYLYLLHESPIREVPYCKIGVTSNPVRRLSQLQAGNPRAIRAWDYQRRPTRSFGLELPTKALACELEQRLLSKFEGMGVRLRQDYNYENDTANTREWIEGVHPEVASQIIDKEYVTFLQEKGITAG